MDIANQPLIGPSISYKKDKILGAIARGQIPKGRNWYAITSAYEERNLLYILSATEFGKPIYHIPGKNLKLIGLAGSREEARNIVIILVKQAIDTNSLAEIKKSLEKY